MHRVKQVVSKPGGIGTSDITVFGSTPAGYVALADATLPPTFRYTLFDFVTFQWEIGYGTYSGGTFSRVGVVGTSTDPDGSTKENFTSEDVLLSTDSDVAEQNQMVNYLYGDGSDGDVVISSGKTTLTSNLYAASLTISGTGKLRPNGFSIYAHKLDLTAAPAVAIEANGNEGTSVASTTGGSGATSPAPTGAVWSVGQAGAGGRDGSTGNGSIGYATSAALATGGQGSAGGAAGGNGATGSGGAAATPGSFTAIQLGAIAHSWRNGSALFVAGTGGVGGSSGGGNGGTAGAGGGGGGSGGGTIAIFARCIYVDGAAVGAISAKGGAGGNSTRASTTGCGGGSGGGGGGGGCVYIVTDAVVGVGTDIIDVSGGDGGDPSDGSATSESGTGGHGGNGGVARVFSSVAGASIQVGAAGTAGDAKLANGAGLLGGAGGAAVFTLMRGVTA